MLLLCSIAFSILCVCEAFYSSIPSTRIHGNLLQMAVKDPRPTKVAVAGASSSVGYIVFQKLLARKNFTPIGLVKDKKGYEKLRKLGVNETQIRICDITVKSSLTGQLEGADKCVICVSATPYKNLSYRIRAATRFVLRRPRRAPRPDELYYKPNERPYELDFVGVKHVIDECVKAKVEHIVILGNMGGYRGSKLNEIGRSEEDPDLKNGNLLKWKRATERYLMKRSFFTIIHAAHLVDEKGGEREVIWDTDDALLRTQFRKISKEDAAEVIVKALVFPQAIGRSIDIASKSRGEGSGPTKDWLRFWSQPGDCVYPSDFDDNQFR